MHASALPDPQYQPEFYDSVTSKRAIAWVIDMVLVFIIAILMTPFTGFMSLFIFPFFLLIVGFAYRVITITLGSATWGMRIMAIELRDMSGAPLTLGPAFVHTLLYSISIGIVLVQAVSIVLMFTSERGQGLSDHLLGTVMLNKRA
ncbi:RDD family protein [Roseobacteraceae bacterium S113]